MLKQTNKIIHIVFIHMIVWLCLIFCIALFSDRAQEVKYVTIERAMAGKKALVVEHLKPVLT